MDTVDAIVIGSGQGGVPFATTLAEQGKRVVLFERERFGGNCINWGCTPSKAFLAAAHAAGRASAAGVLGVNCRVTVDFPKVMERVREIRDRFARSTQSRIEAAGVEVVEAEASFTGQGHVQGGGRSFSAPVTVIDTGSSAALPPIPGLQETPYFTNHNIWELERCPERTLIIGGGFIALEIGQGLSRLGSEVHLLLRGNRVLASESPRVSAVLEEALQRDGIVLHRRTEAKRASPLAGNRVALALNNGETLEGDALLLATGRRPNTEALHVDRAGIELDERGHVRVNDHLESTRPGVYAFGEAAGQPAFTHVSWEDHRRLLATLAGQPRRRDDRVLAYAVFTEPQVGRAGLSPEQAAAKGIAVREGYMDIGNTNRAIEWGHGLGFFQLTVDAESDRIIGATLVGYETAELVHVLLDLIETGATASQLEPLQHIHPTYGEYLPSLAQAARQPE
ncbi:dihydrolipoyl dehydrogenase family protein [Thiohalomonas denitrificans]|uniref:Dihydrolipoamide dehydrogenase n=1 Tax=Thiohalomonas denitrificans TaxID=415747 RepID=A0A1G5PV97_9GAMM|nr:FAD-dependent oxidoreductase [Thiohalomonas denitrificans]SCZ53352.1 dihydrolipoamide dehydrogenase [Thiohalomonas denitrificans]